MIAKCRWKEDEDGNWETQCGGMFAVTVDTPLENGMNFCCYCGAFLVEIRYGSTPDTPSPSTPPE